MFKTFIYFSLLLVLAGCGNVTNGEDSEQQTEETTSEDVEAEQADNRNEALTDTGYHFIDNSEYIENVTAVEDEIREQWEADTYTIESPLISVNPYEIAPLSALVFFETEEPVTVTYYVEGETEDVTIPNSIEEPNTVHEVPILGLYAGTVNNVHIELQDEAGNVQEQQIQIETEEIPAAFYDLELVESNPEEMTQGLTFLNSSGGEYTAVDSLGDIRFMLEPWMANNVEHLDNGNMLIVLRREHDENDAVAIQYDHVLELNMLGKPYNSYIFETDNFDGPFPFDHDIIELDNGNILALVHDDQTDYLEDGIIEFDHETGEVIQATDFKDLFPRSFYEEYEYEGETTYDWLHHNSIDQTEDGESILVSGRNHDMVIKMSYPENKIEWISAADENWPEGDRPDDYLLEPVGDVKFQMAQHAVEEMPDQDGNEDTMDIMLFDNNRYIMRGHEELDEQYSRAVQYRINEEDMTIEEIWSFGEERGGYSYTDIVSDADYHEQTNNVLINFGRTYNEEDEAASQIVEVDKETNEVLFEYHVTQNSRSDRRQIYRADRLPLYDESYEYNRILEN